MHDTLLRLAAAHIAPVARWQHLEWRLDVGVLLCRDHKAGLLWLCFAATYLMALLVQADGFTLATIEVLE